jgi:hypothetical protein
MQLHPAFHLVMVPWDPRLPRRRPSGSVRSRTSKSCARVHGGSGISPRNSQRLTTGGETLHTAAAWRTEVTGSSLTKRTLARAVTAPASIPEFRMETSWPRTPSVRLVHRAVLNTETELKNPSDAVHRHRTGLFIDKITVLTTTAWRSSTRRTADRYGSWSSPAKSLGYGARIGRADGRQCCGRRACRRTAGIRVQPCAVGLQSTIDGMASTLRVPDF